MTELIELLNSIAQDIDFYCAITDQDEDSSRAKADLYFKQFKTTYERIERHKYSEISKFIDNALDQDTVDSLRYGVKEIIRVAELNEYCNDEEDPTNQECFKKISKLYDHIELEAIRYSSIKKIECMADAHSKQETATLNLLESTKATVKETHEQAKHLSQQLISILGIFAGIIVTFSFATTAVGETLANLTKSDIVYLGFVISVLGAIFINVLAFLLSFVTKLSGHTFSKTFPWLIYVIGNIVIIGLGLFFFFKM